MSRVTMKTIAEQTGLSKFAVSRALAGKSGVSEKTRKRVLSVAERLGYQLPTRQESRVIGAIFWDGGNFNGEIHTQIQSGIQIEANNVGYDAQVHWMHDFDEMMGFASKCDGLVTVNVTHERYLNALRGLKVPIVCNGWLEPLDQADSVGGTDHEAGEAVAKHLYGLGHREFAYIHGTFDLRGRRERLNGMAAALSLMAEKTLVHDVTWKTRGGFSERFDALLAEGARPTAFFCAIDDLALTTVTDLMARGWRIPEDISVVGFGDFSAARYIRPPLTTIHTNCIDMGRAAVRLIHSRLTVADWPDMSWRVRVPNILIERDSSGPAPSVQTQERLFGKIFP